MNIVTIMNFADDDKYNLMCMIWMKYVRKFARDADIHILTLDGLPPAVNDYVKSFRNVHIRQAVRHNLGKYNHFNLSVKLYNLAHIDFQFIFMDADMFVLSDLDYLWERRNSMPWIGVDDQTSILRLSAPFSHLNSGLQIISEPSFYDYNLIVKCFENHGRHFICNGEDQALLFDYFKTIGYDYKHPEIGCGWNSSSYYSELSKAPDGKWQANTRNLPEHYPVHIVHYWNGSCRPWHIKCPLFQEEAVWFSENNISFCAQGNKPEAGARRSRVIQSSNPLRIHVMNANTNIIETPGEHPFFPLGSCRIETVDTVEAADFVFWHLDRANVKSDYDKLPFLHSKLFKSNEEKFILYTSIRRPGILYLNNAISFTPFPVYPRETNRLSNVICIPWLLDGIDRSIVENKAFIDECRSMTKDADMIYDKSMQKLATSGVTPGNDLRLCMEDLDTKRLSGMSSAEKVEAGKEVMRKLARSRYYLHFQGGSETPLMLYNALLAGTVPIIAYAPELAFSEFIDWKTFAIFPKPGVSIDGLLSENAGDYEHFRRNGIDFADAFCAFPHCNDKILTLYIAPKLEGKCHAASTHSS